MFAVAQLARLRFRTAAGMVSITWGEAALIVCLYLAPAGWLPAAALLGAGAGLDAHVAGSPTAGPCWRSSGIAASLTAATALAVAVTTAIGEPLLAGAHPGARAWPSWPGSVTYLLITAWLGGATLALRHGVPVGPALLAALRGKVLMFVGNVVVGLVVVALLEIDPRWLLLLPPLLWLLQQTYRHRLRADQERRTWRAFAEATAALNQLDERGVATAARDRRADPVRRRTGGRRRGPGRRPVAALPGRRRRPGASTGRPRRPAGPTGRDHELVRPLVVGAARVGELRVRFPRCAPPSDRERDAVAAYGDALAAALHDAATHRRAAAGQRPLVVRRGARPADRAGQPGGACSPRATRRCGSSPTTIRWRCCCSTSTSSKRSTTPSGTRPAISCCGRPPTGWATLARAGDLLARLGGDEFALLLTSVPVIGDRAAPMAYALRRAREIAERLAAPTEVAGVRMSVEVSVGVVVAGAGTADLTELLRRADIAMYQAKEGGGSVAAYDSRPGRRQHRPAGAAGRAAGGAADRRPAGAGAATGGRPEPPAHRPGWRR